MGPTGQFDLVSRSVDLLTSALPHADVIIHFCLIQIILEIQINFENSYLLNRNSDENVFYMKVAQNDAMNLNTRSFYLSDASNYLNMEHFPSNHLSDTGPEPGIHSRLIFPLHLYRVAIR